MEKDKQSKEEFLVKKILKEIDSEKAPKNFTANVMHVIAEQEQVVLEKQAPLISKKLWLMAIAFSSLCFYVVFEKGNSLFTLFPETDFSFLQKIEISNLFSSVSVSNSVVLICGIFTLMVFLQIFYLKNHFEKRYEV